jgi:hypothetical protein
MSCFNLIKNYFKNFFSCKKENKETTNQQLLNEVYYNEMYDNDIDNNKEYILYNEDKNLDIINNENSDLDICTENLYDNM